MKEKSIDLGQCIIDCENDQSCEESCVNLFKEQYDQCPCQVGRSKKFNRLRWLVITCNNGQNIFQDDCPSGCPCDAFDCQPDKKSVLVLSTYRSLSKPVLIKYDGEFD